jgi:hypothetical protein
MFFNTLGVAKQNSHQLQKHSWLTTRSSFARLEFAISWPGTAHSEPGNIPVSMVAELSALHLFGMVQYGLIRHVLEFIGIQCKEDMSH